MTTIRNELADIAFADEVLWALGIDLDLPAEWATVDRCLTWLRERALDIGEITPIWIDGDVSRPGYSAVIFGPEDCDEFSGEAATAHAALIAACQAVQEAD